MQVKCSMKGCETVTEVSNPAPDIRFICKNHERSEVKKFLGVKRYNPSEDEDRNARFDNHSFEKDFRAHGPNRDGEQPDSDFSTGVVGIPFDQT